MVKKLILRYFLISKNRIILMHFLLLVLKSLLNYSQYVYTS